MGRREAQSKINRLREYYDELTEKAGIQAEKERMTVRGFRAVKEISRLKNSARSGTIPSSTTNVRVNGVNFICRIDRNTYSCVTEDITTDEVVISDERIAHIKARHPNDFERYFAYMGQILQVPDYILEDKANTALVLKEFEEDGNMFRMVLQLKTSADNPTYKNSVLTFMKTNAKKWQQNLRNKKILYKREK